MKQINKFNAFYALIKFLIALYAKTKINVKNVLIISCEMHLIKNVNALKAYKYFISNVYE